MGFVIYLSSNMGCSRVMNAYGYWTGKMYTHQGEYFPVCTPVKDSTVKVYRYHSNACRGAEKAYIKFGYVSAYAIETL